ncbi:MAG: hypothetical protein FJ272_16305, partial [Planctomycetes bacterium]|nr:hypothetical protein [Planctomycetota bacterium]
MVDDKWPIRLGGVAVVLASFLAVLAWGADESPNLVRNADFEASDAAAWEKRTPDDADRTLSMGAEAARSGQGGARIVNRKPVWSRWRQGADGKLSVPAGATVRLSGWIRTDLGAEGFATLRLYCMAGPDKILAQPATRPVTGKSDWKRVSLTTSVPEGTAFVMAYLELQNAAGTADYDDLTLSLVSPPEQRMTHADLLLLTDAPADDLTAKSLQTLYPGMVVADKLDTQGRRGVALLARKDETAFDFKGLESFVAQGKPAVVDLGVYAKWRGVQVRETAGGEQPSLRIVREHRATRGFKAGDGIPWFGGEKGRWTQRALEGAVSGQVLAESSRGGAVLVAEDVGKGIVLATDLAGLPEPVWNLPGALNKYLFLGNLLGESVRYGEHYAKRLKYGEFVDAMRDLAAELSALRVEDEGPAHGAYRLYSLNLGDPKKPAFLLYAATHGSEWEPAYGLLTLARRLASRPDEKLPDLGRYCVKIIPFINPSGYDLNTRQNAAKVDLNRNAGEWWESFQG